MTAINSHFDWLIGLEALNFHPDLLVEQSRV